MYAWLITQHNPETNETNISFVTEPVANAEDWAIRSGSWAECPLSVVPVWIAPVQPNGDISCLENRAFKADGFVDSEEALLHFARSKSK